MILVHKIYSEITFNISDFKEKHCKTIKIIDIPL